MGRKAIEINPQMGKRLTEWLDDVNITQATLADRTGYTQQYISSIVTGKKNMSVEFARLVSEKIKKPFFNIYGDEIGSDQVRPQWLLCLDDNKTFEDWANAISDERERVFNSEWSILDRAARKQGMKIILNHPFSERPSYFDQLNWQKDRCSYSILKGNTSIKEFSVHDFIKLTQQLEKYAEYLIWSVAAEAGGSDNG